MNKFAIDFNDVKVGEYLFPSEDGKSYELRPSGFNTITQEEWEIWLLDVKNRKSYCKIKEN